MRAGSSVMATMAEDDNPILAENTTALSSSDFPSQLASDLMTQRSLQDGVNGTDLQHTWNGTMMGSTNANSFQPAVIFDKNNLYPIEYFCPNIVAQDFNLSDATIWFDFEASIEINASIEENSRALEWSILKSLVDVLGLDQCNLAALNLSNRKTMKARLRRRLQTKAPTIVKLSSLPRDDIGKTGKNAKFAGFSSTITIALPNLTHYFISEADVCDYLQYNQTLDHCVQIRGLMTATFRGQGASAVEDYLRRLIQEMMTGAPEKLFVKEVTGLKYVGNKFGQPYPFSGATGQVQSSANQASHQILGAVLPVSAFVLLMGTFLLLLSRRRRDRNTRSRGTSEKPIGDEVEIGRDSASVETTKLAQTLSQTASEEEDHGGTSDIERQGATVTLSSDTAESPESSCPSSKEENPPKGELISVDSQDSESQDTAAAVVGAALPPRPPVDRRRSQNLKKKRRKKKKKKTQPLQRVNSKEGIKEMEPIPESEGEQSEFGSEYDSECSTEDDEFGSRTSSGCTTPVRSRSRNGSRASTPQLSPQDELFPKDVFSDFDFTIEAPDFPFDTSKVDVPNLANEDDLKPSGVSPSREKIKPLPPPWV